MMTGKPDDQLMPAPDDCDGCPLHDTLQAPAAMQRREFLRVAGLAMASIGMIGAGARDAMAMPVHALAALAADARDAGSEKRYPVPATDGVAIDKDNSVIIARADGKIYAFSLACPHQNTALRWDADDHQFQCPKHHSRYREDGTFISGRATRNMDRLPIRRAGAELVVDVDTLYQQDEDAAAWASAFVAA